MKTKEKVTYYEIELLMQVFTLLLAAVNVVVIYDTENIVINGEKDGRKIKLRLSMIVPQLKYFLADRDKPTVNADCYVDEKSAFKSLSINPEAYEQIAKKIFELSKLKNEQFSEQDAWDFLKLDKIEGSMT